MVRRITGSRSIYKYNSHKHAQGKGSGICVLEIYISHMRYIAYAFCNISYRICDISHMRYLTLQKRECDISDMRYRFPQTLALCLGSGYLERTINNAYAFLICTSKVRSWFPKWHQKVEPTSCERPKKFDWNPKCEESFKKLKTLLTSAPILRIENPNKDFVVCTNACNDGLGDVLTQEGHVTAYESRNLKITRLMT